MSTKKAVKAAKPLSASAAKPVSAPAAKPAKKPVLQVKKAAVPKAAAKPVTKVPKVAASPKAAAKAESKPAKAAKASKKPKVVRDSFTMPQSEYQKIAQVKAVCLKSGMQVKKSEVLRAGVVALCAMSEAQLIKALGSLDKIKTGRPNKQH